MSSESINNTHLAPLVIQNNLEKTNSKLAVCLEHLSSGLRVNHPKDNPGTFSVDVHIQSYIDGLYSAKRNTNDAISLNNIAQDAVCEAITILQNARELAVQSANGTNTSLDRQCLQNSVNQIICEMSAIANNTSFNNMNLLNGSVSSVNFQTGPMANQAIPVSLPNINTNSIGANELTSNSSNGIEQASYGSYVEANGSSITVNSGLTNDIAASSTISFTPINSNASLGAPTVVTPVAGNTASDLAAAVNATNMAKASAYTAVNLTGFTITNGNTITIGTNPAHGTNVSGPVIDSTYIGGTNQETYSNVATAINANASMQNYGVYAIAAANQLTVISPNGYDITATSTGTATLGGMQILNSAGANIGSNAPLTAGNSLTAVGILSVESMQNVNMSFGDTKIFNSPSAINAGVFDTQSNNFMAAQTINVAGNQGNANISLNSNETANQVAISVNNSTDSTGVSATAITNAVLQNVSADGTVGFNLIGDNSVGVAISANVNTNDLTPLMQAINNVSGATGITAQTYNSNAAILLTDLQGNNIQITNFTHSAANVAEAVTPSNPVTGDGSSLPLPNYQSIQVLGNPDSNPNGTTVTLYAGGARNNINSTVVGGEVDFASISPFAVSSNIDGKTYSGSLFNAVAGTNNTSAFTSIADIDVSTSQGAQSAIGVIDQTITQLTQMSANFGAFGSRFDSSLRMISDNILNLEEARSAMMDTDIAHETAKLTKLQILSQSGLAVLAQANCINKEYLTLLQHN
jgi:flagellin